MKVLLVFLVFVLYVSPILLADPITSVELVAGRNTVVVGDYFSAYPVSYLFVRNPSLQSVTVERYGQTFVYVNVFGGVGTDFLFEPGVSYEVYSSSNMTLFLSG